MGSQLNLLHGTRKQKETIRKKLKAKEILGRNGPVKKSI